MPTMKTLTVDGKTYTIEDGGAQRTLVSGTNIKTINNESLLGSGNITLSSTDEKLKWTASTSTDTFYPLQSNSSATTSTANTLNGISVYQYYNIAGGYRRLNLGNSTAYKSTGGAYGTIRLYGSAATYYGDLVPGVLGTTSGDGHISANRTWTLPDKTGTVALTSDIPTKTSDLTNDSGFITGYTETDPTVPSWAKASTKPAYTASEVGAQAILVSGTNIKTINNKSLLGSGNISIVNEAEEFTGTRSNAIYRGECFGTYDPNSNSVTLIYHFYHNSDIPTSYTLFTIPEKYRPTTTKYGAATYTTGSGGAVSNYHGYVTSGGIVRQDISGSCRSGFGVIKYILN